MINMEQKTNNSLSIVRRRGAALLVVLFIVMAITILSLGFLSRSDVELACGRNMVLRTQMDYLADSGLEHARGLILNPQDVDAEYWKGAEAQQLVAGSAEYYDLDIVRDDSDRCNYTIDCTAYWMEESERIGRSELRAQLRLDPCIALWTGNDTTLWDGISVNGDVYCNGTLVNGGAIDGDAFANALSGSGISGQLKPIADLSLDWPRVTVADFTTYYATQNIGTGTISGQTFGPYSPVRVCYRNGNLVIAGNVRIEGMLVVDGDLVVQGNANTITAAKKLPALLVTGDLVVSSSGDLDVDGLAVINGGVQVSAGDGNIQVLGGLFVQGELVETTADSSGNGNAGTLYGGSIWQPGTGRIGGALRFDNADGTNDYVQIENESLFDITGQITVAAWIRVNEFNRSFQPIFTKGDSAWRIQRFSNTNNIEFACTGLSHSVPYGSLTGSISVNDGLWHHVAGVYDGSQVYLYVDGNLDISMPSSGNISTNNYKVLIGANAQQSDRCWNGWIDDVRIYNRGLDVNDVDIVRAGGTTVSGLIGHWRLDESGSDVDIITAPEKTAILVGAVGDEEKWGQAAGAFFRSIKRR